MKTKLILLCSLMVLTIEFFGCGQSGDQSNFVMEISRDSPAFIKNYDIILEVNRFKIASEFDTKKLVYRKSRSEFETDFYNQFLVSPDKLITERTRHWLTQSGLFEAVIAPDSIQDSTHSLQAYIAELYGDFRNKSKPVAQVTITFHLLKNTDKSVIFLKTYKASSDIESLKAEDVVDAYDRSIKMILSDLEKDLQISLENLSQNGGGGIRTRVP